MPHPSIYKNYMHTLIIWHSRANIHYCSHFDHYYFIYTRMSASLENAGSLKALIANIMSYDDDNIIGILILIMIITRVKYIFDDRKYLYSLLQI